MSFDGFAIILVAHSSGFLVAEIRKSWSVAVPPTTLFIYIINLKVLSTLKLFSDTKVSNIESLDKAKLFQIIMDNYG